MFAGNIYEKRDMFHLTTKIKVYEDTVDDGTYLVRDKFKRLWLYTLLWDKVYEFYEARFELVRNENDADELYEIGKDLKMSVGRAPYFYVSDLAFWELHT